MPLVSVSLLTTSRNRNVRHWPKAFSFGSPRPINIILHIVYSIRSIDVLNDTKHHQFDMGNFILKAFLHCFCPESLQPFALNGNAFHFASVRIVERIRALSLRCLRIFLFVLCLCERFVFCVCLHSLCLCDDYELDVEIHLVILTEMCKHNFTDIVNLSTHTQKRYHNYILYLLSIRMCIISLGFIQCQWRQVKSWRGKMLSKEEYNRPTIWEKVAHRANRMRSGSYKMCVCV